MMFNLLVVVIALLSVVFAQDAKKWEIVSGTMATTLVGVGANFNSGVAACGENNVGAFVNRYSSGSWNKEFVQAGLLMDAAVTPSGVTVASSVFPIFVSKDGATYTKVSSISGASQSASAFGKNGESLALVGSFAVNNGGKIPVNVNGVVSSVDSGDTWTVSSPIPSGYSRYGAFPSDNTWFISSGMWGEDPQANSTSVQFSSRVHVDKEGKYSFVDKRRVGDSVTGWFGAVSKTTDGGKTWTEVFSSDREHDYYYFNGISCGSENNCIVVGEGDDASGKPLVVAFATFDGGKTWEKTFTSNNVGLMSVKFVSENEAWMAGADKKAIAINGLFWKTVDGGKTFNLEQTLSNCFVLDMDFGGDVGYAACASSSGSTASVAMYH